MMGSARNENLKTKKLDDVEPFNGYLFKSCYYHQLIAGYAHFGVDKNFVLMNYLPLYFHDERTCSCGIDDIPLFTENETHRNTGVRLAVKNNSKNIVKEVIRCIDRNQPVLVAVDASALPHRTDVYKKLNTLHYLLVYGYDIDAHEFIAMEHYFKNSYVYRESRIGFDLLLAGFLKAVSIFGKENRRMVVRMIKTGECRREPVLKRSYNSELESSYGALERIIRQLKDCYESERNYFEKAVNLPQFYGSYAHKKRIQQNCFDNILSDPKLSENLHRITENITFILGATQKTLLMRNYDTRLIAKILQRLDEILQLEKSVHEVFTEFYVKGRRLW